MLLAAGVPLSDPLATPTTAAATSSTTIAVASLHRPISLAARPAPSRPGSEGRCWPASSGAVPGMASWSFIGVLLPRCVLACGGGSYPGSALSATISRTGKPGSPDGRQLYGIALGGMPEGVVKQAIEGKEPVRVGQHGDAVLAGINLQSG